MDHDRADFDDIAWEESKKWLQDATTIHLMESLAMEKFGKRATLVRPLITGGYNVVYRMRLEGSSTSNDVLVRIPGPNLAQFPDEKTRGEVAAARYIEQNTLIPVPRIYHYGLSDLSSKNSCSGPFIIMQWIENHRSFSDALTRPNEDPSETHVLNPDIPEDMLMRLYAQMARHLLELSHHHFDRIGALVETSHNSYSIAGRPISVNMNNMIQLANIPRIVLPPQDKTYSTT